MTTTKNAVDLERLLKLRLVVARFGEMDAAGWWNSKGMLGRHGAIVLKRGFPKTHFFAQARVVFSVARARCNELFEPPGCMTLWNLPARLEDAFEERWHDWLDERDRWSPLFEQLQGVDGQDLLATLDRFHLLADRHREEVARLKRSAEGKAVALPGVFAPDDDVLTLLAAGFSKGERGRPAIPYARLEG